MVINVPIFPPEKERIQPIISARNSKFKKPMIYQTAILLFVVLSVLIIIQFIVVTSNSKGRNSQISPRVKEYLSTGFDECKLPRHDFWEPEIIKFFDPWVSRKSCNTDYKPITSLNNGKLSSSDNNKKCWGRCLEYDKETSVKYGEWISTDKDFTFACDIVEALCSNGTEPDPSTGTYGWVHTQIVENKSENLELNSTEKYNVYVILLDSHAHSQAHRNLPKTLNYLLRSLNAIEIPFVSKVGRNSYPNAIALFYGKTAEPQRRALFGLPDIAPELTEEASCGIDASTQEQIFTDFRNAGYKSFYGGDWSASALAYPNCKGFVKSPTDHNFTPFSLAQETAKDKALSKTMTSANCHDINVELLKYFQQFIKSYSDLPKFAWLWMTNIAHDSESSSIPYDTNFYDFLIKNRKEFDKSFLFFMGDHGLRFSEVSSTKVGSIDNKNPMLFLSLPEKLRSNKALRDIMSQNAQNLQTHFDTRATLLDILKYQPQSEFQDRTYLKMPGEYGSSYLRKQPQPRNCKTLPVPFEYCICQYQMLNISTNSSEAISVGEAVISHINQILDKNSLTKCTKWSLDKVTSLLGYEPLNATRSYKVILKPKEPYAEAVFSTHVHQNSNGSFTVSTVDRLDQYGDRGECVDGKFKPICHCQKKS